MIIGFDAKRAFLNRSGLGNYSRSIISLLNTYYPENEYLLYTTDTRNTLFEAQPSNRIIGPQQLLLKKFPAAWRTFFLNSELKKDKPDIYHGLSNELPYGISKTKIRSVVTIHDLIFIRYPGLYPWFDRQVYKSKFRYACETADRVLAVSEATRQDILNYFHINPEKTKVSYQTCNPIFLSKVSDTEKTAIRIKYKLPQEFILSVGSIEERKNALLIVKALKISGIDTTLVLIGKPTPYLQKIKEYIANHRMESKVLILQQVPTIDLPALYQAATAFIYPSLYEGFGIPILEALFSGTPVITSKGGCFTETAGDAALYTDPASPEELAGLINRVLGDTELRKAMISDGTEHAMQFTGEEIAKRLMEIYRDIVFD